MSERPAKCPQCDSQMREVQHQECWPDSSKFKGKVHPWHSQPDASPTQEEQAFEKGFDRMGGIERDSAPTPPKGMFLDADGRVKCSKCGWLRETMIQDLHSPCLEPGHFAKVDAPTPERTMNAHEAVKQYRAQFPDLSPTEANAYMDGWNDCRSYMRERQAEQREAKVERDERTPKDERAAFEEWARTTNLDLDFSDGDYECREARVALRAWQARAALVQKEKA